MRGGVTYSLQCSFGSLAYFLTRNSSLGLSNLPLANKYFLSSFSQNVFLSSSLCCPSLPSSGSPAELCQLCVDDEIVAVNGVAVAHLNYTQWKDKMTSSLQTGSLTMDIRRYGNKGETMSRKKKDSCVFLPPSEMICDNSTSDF